MHDVDFQRLVADLVRAGITQPQIAAGVGCGQSTISDLIRGATREPRYALGQRLIAIAHTHGVVPVQRNVAAQPAAAQA